MAVENDRDANSELNAQSVFDDEQVVRGAIDDVVVEGQVIDRLVFEQDNSSEYLNATDRGNLWLDAHDAANRSSAIEDNVLWATSEELEIASAVGGGDVLETVVDTNGVVTFDDGNQFSLELNELALW